MKRREFLKVCLAAVIIPLTKILHTSENHIGVDMAHGKDSTAIAHWRPAFQVHDSIFYECYYDNAMTLDTEAGPLIDFDYAEAERKVMASMTVDGKTFNKIMDMYMDTCAITINS